jgi:hypothetical protein
MRRFNKKYLSPSRLPIFLQTSESVYLICFVSFFFSLQNKKKKDCLCLTSLNCVSLCFISLKFFYFFHIVSPCRRPPPPHHPPPFKTFTSFILYICNIKVYMHIYITHTHNMYTHTLYLGLHIYYVLVQVYLYTECKPLVCFFFSP